MSITAEQLSKEKEISEFVMKDHTLKILLAEDNALFQTVVIKRIGEAISANIQPILTKLKVSFKGGITISEEKQDKDLILSYHDDERIVQVVEIRLAVNGNDAIEIFKKSDEHGKPFNYVLMNHRMPECLGSEAIETIRKYEKDEKEKAKEKALESCVIIGWTSDDEYKELMMTKGANKFYRKSIHYDVIEKLVLEGIFELPLIKTFDTEQREGFKP